MRVRNRLPRGRTGIFVGICALSFLVNFGRIAFAPLVDVFIRSGVAPATAGLVASAVWIGSALSRLPAGYVLTRVRRHRLVLVAGGALAVAAAATAMAPGIGLTIAGALAVGLTSGGFYIAANPLVSELYPERVGRMLGLRAMSSQVAAVSAPAIVGAAIWLGSWRLAFGGLAAAATISTASLARTAGRTSLPSAGQKDRALLRGIREQWRLIGTGVAFVGVTGFVWQGVFNFYITALDAMHGVPAGTASGLLTLTFVAGVPSMWVAGRLADRAPPARILPIVTGVFACCLVGFTLVDTRFGVIGASIAMGLAIHALFPVADAYLLDTLPDTSRGSAYAGYSATMMLIQAPGSVAVGTLAGAGFSYTRIFRLYAGFVVLLTLVMAALAVLGWLPGSRGD
jgi:DHA1 family inner membrane transport protein